MVSMGVGNKPFLDIKPSEAAINDRAIDYIMKGRGRCQPCLSLLQVSPAGWHSWLFHCVLWQLPGPEHQLRCLSLTIPTPTRGRRHSFLLAAPLLHMAHPPPRCWGPSTCTCTWTRHCCLVSWHPGAPLMSAPALRKMSWSMRRAASHH